MTIVKSINILKESQIPELTENVIPIVEKFYKVIKILGSVKFIYLDYNEKATSCFATNTILGDKPKGL